MALKYIEGFESYFTDVGQNGAVMTATNTGRYAEYPLGACISSVSGYYGGYGVKISGDRSYILGYLNQPLLAGGTQIGFGFRYKKFGYLNSVSIGISYPYNFINGTIGFNTYPNYGVEITNDVITTFTAQKMKNSPFTSVHTSTITAFKPYNDNQWHYIDVLLGTPLIQSTVVSYSTITLLDGLPLSSGILYTYGYGDPTSIYTDVLPEECYALLMCQYRAGSTSLGTNYTALDDFYITDGDTTNNGIVGLIPNAWRCKVQQILPTGDVLSQWSPSAVGLHANLVDEIPINTLDYVAATGIGDIDTYTYSKIPQVVNGQNIVGSIYGIRIDPVVRMITGSSRTVTPVINDTDIPSLNINLNTTNNVYKANTQILEHNPTGVHIEWNPDTINNIEAGMKFSNYF